MSRKLAVALVLVTGLVAGTVPYTAPAGAATLYIVPRSIDTSGSQDVSRPMAEFLASVPDGSVVRLRYGGRYRMEQTLLLRNRHNLLIQGNGATIFATTTGGATRSHVRVEDSSGITIRNLSVQGPNPLAGTAFDAYVEALEHQHGFDIRSSSNVQLIDVKVSGTYGDFVYLGRREDGPWTSGVVVRGGRFERNGRQGISFIAVRNVLVERNYLNDVRRATFDFEPEGGVAGVDGVTIRYNEIGRGRLMFVAAQGSGPVNNVTITSNTLRGQSLQFYVSNAYTGRRNTWKVTSNTSDATVGNPQGAAMMFRRVSGLVVRYNTQAFQAGRNMVVANLACSSGTVVSTNVRPGSVGEFRLASC